MQTSIWIKFSFTEEFSERKLPVCLSKKETEKAAESEHGSHLRNGKPGPSVCPGETSSMVISCRSDMGEISVV